MKRITTPFLAISFTGWLYAQDIATIKFSFNHLALSVKDVNRSAAFYTTVLKLPEIVNRTKIEGIRWFALADGKELHLISTIKENVIINKAIHMGLSINNFDEFVKQLTALKSLIPIGRESQTPLTYAPMALSKSSFRTRMDTGWR